MNLVYGEILTLFAQSGMQFARVRVGGAIKPVPVDLVADAAPGDCVLVCDGVAIGKVHPRSESIHVSGHSR